ncbi:CCR4-NOT transcription complex subunit 6-like [Trichonephila clavata]|uniref:CCR4-NOT transcription complex subunit 6-like n=1 Tax=Trichonephila clavata TaxID=2740835 RepID=A0A8X6G6R4_TRICU|nr:CCR4-NOT transcription complex subunit 6-like [Trichonephila clavata]
MLSFFPNVLFWDLDEADLMSKRYPKKKERNHYVHPNPRRLYCIMPVDEASKRPKEEYTELEITGNVRRLSSSLWQMTSLTSLYLNNNALTSIPSEISLLVNLAHLNLSFNQLRNIPPEMGDMTSLRELLLNNNNISTLPTQLGKLFKLCKLELTGNPLGGHIMDIIRSPSCRTEDILSYLIDHLPETRWSLRGPIDASSKKKFGVPARYFRSVEEFLMSKKMHLVAPLHGKVAAPSENGLEIRKGCVFRVSWTAARGPSPQVGVIRKRVFALFDRLRGFLPFFFLSRPVDPENMIFSTAVPLRAPSRN